MPPDVLAALRAFKTRQAKHHLGWAAAGQIPGWWRPTPTAPPVRPETYSKALAFHCAAMGVPVISLHDVRHTAATTLLDGGTTPSATAKWLGHDPAITLWVYGHVFNYALASAGDALLGRSRANGDR